MRKIITLICALAILMFPCGAFAEDVSGSGSQATSTLTYHVDSQFSVSIPATIDVTNEAYYFTSSMMDIGDSEKVLVKVTTDSDGFVTLTSGSGKTVKLGFTRVESVSNISADTVGMFTKGQTTSSIGFTCSPSDMVSAGDYEGQVTFSIWLE